MIANRLRSIKEFFTHKESRQQESCLHENDNPTPSRSFDEGSEHRGVDYSNQDKCFYLCYFWFIELCGVCFFQVTFQVRLNQLSIFSSILLAQVRRGVHQFSGRAGLAKN